MKRPKLRELNDYYTTSTYYNLLNMLSGMFEYGGDFPDYLESEDIEILMMHRGFSSVLDNRENDGEFKVGMISGFDLNDYLRPIGQCDFYTRNVEYGTHEIGKDVVVGYNNKLRLPELKIRTVSDNLTEIEKSKRVAIVNTRFTNIPVVEDSKMATAIDKVISDIAEGRKVSSVQKSFIDALKDNGDLTTLSLTNPDDVDKIQYIYKAYDDEMRDFLEFYGQTYTATSKMAQVNTSELQGGFNFSKVVPMNMLSCRQKFVDTINKTFKVNWTVDFSEAWQHLKKVDISDTTKNFDVETENGQSENDEKGESENDT